MEPSISCEHLTVTTCTLGLFGGRPYPRNCVACIAAGENRPDYARELFARQAITHPPGKPAISGCCDPVNL
jgi:hypothetical protein